MEIPYSTKLLTYEQETYLNLSMRYMTTSGFQRLTPLEFSGTSSEVVKMLQPMQLPEVVAPAYVEDKPVVSLTVEQLRSLAAHRDKLSQEEQAQLDVIQEESQVEEQEAQMNAMTGLQVAPPQPQVWGDEAIVGPPMQNQLVVPQQQQQQQQMTGGMIGGMPLPSAFGPGGTPQMSGEGLVRGPAVPGMGPLIAVRTDMDAFARDGIMLDGGTRPIRRNYYSAPGPAVDRYTPQAGGQFLSAMNGGADAPGVQQTVKVTKLE
jgi:hypothetical protein